MFTRRHASFLESQHIAGHNFTCEEAERLAERERIWETRRAPTLNPESKQDWDTFWTAQNGICALFRGLGQPTGEHIAMRIWDRLKPVLSGIGQGGSVGE